jgi:MFS family permease
MDNKKISIRQTFAALRHRNYRLWFTGQIISLFGSWMQTTAQGFLIYELTKSPAYLGYVGFASGIPSWIFTLYGGVVADRFSKRSVLIVTELIMMILAFILAGLTFLHIITPLQIVFLSFMLGIANAFDAPARQSFVLELVDREDLVNAIALNGTMFNSAAAIGPAIAGLTYAAFGPSWCFTINGLSFIGVIIALAMMRIEKPDNVKIKKSATAELKDGMVYLRKQKMIMLIIAIIAVTALFGISFTTLIPAWAVNILHGDASTNGFLQSFRGLGALVSALMIASISHLKIKGKLFSFSLFAFPAAILIFSFVKFLPLSFILIFTAGIAQVFILNLANGFVQTVVSDEYRGRVMAVYSMTFFGFMPIGSLFIGYTAHFLGEQTAVIINSSVLLLFAAVISTAYPALRKLK